MDFDNESMHGAHSSSSPVVSATAASSAAASSTSNPYPSFQMTPPIAQEPGSSSSSFSLQTNSNQNNIQRQTLSPPVSESALITIPESPLYISPDVAADGGPGDPTLTYVVITNDGNMQNLVWLASLKEIFSKQLPKMPKEYITRLVFDKKHCSMVCIHKGQVIGGICCRNFPTQYFSEIVFCAVSSQNQVKGYGSKLMNHLKEYMKTIGITHFLTYADNFAVGYFKKQGFTVSITMQKERWHHFIKDYDGGTMMECVINQYVDYLRVPSMIKRHREYLLQKVSNLSKVNVVYDGLPPLNNKDASTQPIQIPGIIEAGWNNPVVSSPQPPHPESPEGRQIIYRGILEQVYNHPDAWPFYEPVPETVTNYLFVIKKPIDLSMIRRKIEIPGSYKSIDDLRADLELMCNNCKEFNPLDTPYHRAAIRIEQFFTGIFDEFQEYEKQQKQ